MPDGIISDNILRTLSKMAQIQNSDTPLNITFMVGLNYDSNVNDDANEGTFNIFGSSIKNKIIAKNKVVHIWATS